MFQTVMDATLTDVFRGVVLVGFLLLLSVTVVYLWGAVQEFHRKGKARLAAYEKKNSPSPVKQSNVIVFPPSHGRMS